MKNSPHILAARYALGIADASEVEAAQGMLDANEDFAILVAEFQAVFDGLHEDLSPVAPPADMWSRIETAIGSDDKSRQPIIISARNKPWQDIGPDLQRKYILSDDEVGVRMVLYRAGPGAIVQRHRNPYDEECLVLEGEIEVNGESLRSGEMHIVPAGSLHGPIVSRVHSLIYIREGSRK